LGAGVPTEASSLAGVDDLGLQLQTHQVHRVHHEPQQPSRAQASGQFRYRGLLMMLMSSSPNRQGLATMTTLAAQSHLPRLLLSTLSSFPPLPKALSALLPQRDRPN
jgi:hypothetical protein